MGSGDRLYQRLYAHAAQSDKHRWFWWHGEEYVWCHLPLPFVQSMRVCVRARVWIVDVGILAHYRNIVLATDVKRRATTNYLICTGGNGQLFLWSLNPITGELASVKVATSSYVREYTCMQFSADREWLYVGTTTGDFACVSVRLLLLDWPLLPCGLLWRLRFELDSRTSCV